MLDPLRARFPWSTPLSDENPDIEPLWPEDLGGLRLPWLSKFSSETRDIQRRANPGMALSVPNTGEYIVAERWRRRDDIGHIVEVTARRSEEHTSELQSPVHLVCRLLLEKKNG